jgi:DUF2917 family protein
MNLKIDGAERVLRFRDVIRLEDAAGTRLRVRRGSVWITQHGDSKDYYLPASGTITLDRPGLALVDALEPTELVLWRPVPKISFTTQFARGIARVWRALPGWLARRSGPEAIENRGLHGAG